MLPDQFNEPYDTPFFTTEVAGLQFYEYYLLDDLTNEPIRPKFGERIELVRQPDNRHDSNAVEVWYKNGQHQLGHLPRDIAALVAPAMDAGRHLRAYAVLPGDGGPWSAEVIVCGDGIPDCLHQQHLRHAWRKLDADLEAQASTLGRERGKAFKEADAAFRKARLFGSVDVLIDALAASEAKERKAAPALAFTAERSIGSTFKWWDDIPNDSEGNPQFRTKTQWTEGGYKLKKGEKPSAHIEYGKRKHFRRYGLYGSHQIEPKKPATAAQIAKGYRLLIDGDLARKSALEQRRAHIEERSLNRSGRYGYDSLPWWDRH